MYGATDDQDAAATSKQPAASGQAPRANIEQPQGLANRHIFNEQHAIEGISGTAYLCAACAALNSFNLGYDLGINSDAGPVLRQDLHLSDRQYEVFNGILPLFSALGCVLTASISDTYGRRQTFLTSNLTLFVGVVVVSMASSYELLLLGRVLVGIGIGIGMSVDPVYIAELAPPSSRGWLVTWSEISIAIGVFAGSLAGWIFKEMGQGHAWRGMFAVGGITPVIMVILVSTVMLESPRWLLFKERDEEADEVIASLFGEHANVDSIKQDIRSSLADEAVTYNVHSWADILCPGSGPLRWMMITGVLSGIAQQVVGIEPLLFYNQLIFRSAGETSTANLSLYPVIFNGVKLCVTICTGKLLDIYGRRPLMIISFSGIAICCFTLAVSFSLNATPVWLVILSIAMYGGSFGAGAGPGCWLLSSELFSTTVRAKGMSVAAMTNRLVAALYLTTALTLVGRFGLGTVFGILGVFSSIYVVFFWKILPETKGETLEEITEGWSTAGKGLDEETPHEAYSDAARSKNS